MKYILITLIAVIAASAYASSPTLEKLDDKDFETGCGYYVGKGMDTVVASATGDGLNIGDPVVVRVNGKVHKLNFKSSSVQHFNSLERLGSTFSIYYEDKEILLRLDHKITHNCRGPRKHPDCEGISYKVDALLRVGTEQSRIKKLEGYHGC
jgi:hypothetical protein